MNNEEKELLLKDLCARLPYGVMLNTPIGNKTLLALVFSKEYNTIVEYNDYHGNENDISEWEGGDIEFVRPYLRSLSFMTVEERKEYGLVLCGELSINQFDWLKAHHFDYRNLIEKGLAIEVTKDNNPYE